MFELFKFWILNFYYIIDVLTSSILKLLFSFHYIRRKLLTSLNLSEQKSWLLWDDSNAYQVKIYKIYSNSNRIFEWKKMSQTFSTELMHHLLV